MVLLLGFEREDPAGLYTYSRAYANEQCAVILRRDFNLVDVTNRSDGMLIAYSADVLTLSAHQTFCWQLACETDDLNLELALPTLVLNTLVVVIYYDNQE